MKQFLPVNEVFDTIQGEASFTGTPAVFIRLQGCAVGCPWCDTRHTWERDAKHQVEPETVLAKTASGSPTWAAISIDDLVACCEQAAPIRHVVITGGEPCDHDLTDLTAALIECGLFVQIETSGTASVEASTHAWVTLSPKVGMPGGKQVLSSVIARANEIKHPVGREQDLEALRLILELRRSLGALACPTWLQPLSMSPKATAFAADACRANGSWRLSLQGHALAGIR